MARAGVVLGAQVRVTLQPGGIVPVSRCRVQVHDILEVAYPRHAAEQRQAQASDLLRVLEPLIDVFEDDDETGLQAHADE